MVTQRSALDTSGMTSKLLAWPASDVRLDAAHGNQADIAKEIFNGLQGIPILLSFGVSDNGTIVSDNRIRYNWDRNCECSHERTFTREQVEFIHRYDPAFFEGIPIRSASPNSRLVDSPIHYTRFVEFFKAHNPDTIVGSYISAVTCAKGATHPHTENYYPPSMVDCYQLASRGPDGMGTPPFLPGCPQNPGRWRINVATPGVTREFYKQVRRIVKETTPKPPFLFLDNVTYLQPEFLWRTGEKKIDCRDRSSAGLDCCRAYQDQLAKEIGPGIYFDDLIRHYRRLRNTLERAGVRAIFNVAVPPALLGHPKEAAKYADQLEEAVGTNGMAFEQPFHPNPRTNAQDTAQEIATHKRLLAQGKLVVFYANYDDIRESSWIAAMAMLIRNPGQSLFVARNQEKPPAWTLWPSRYGAPLADASFQVIGGTPTVGNHWISKRVFQNGELAAGHFGARKGEPFDVAALAPELVGGGYSVLSGYEPKLGTFDAKTNTYQAGGTLGTDYIVFGAQPDGSGFYGKLITISARIFD